MCAMMIRIININLYNSAAENSNMLYYYMIGIFYSRSVKSRLHKRSDWQTDYNAVNDGEGADDSKKRLV